MPLFTHLHPLMVINSVQGIILKQILLHKIWVVQDMLEVLSILNVWNIQTTTMLTMTELINTHCHPHTNHLGIPPQLDHMLHPHQVLLGILTLIQLT